MKKMNGGLDLGASFLQANRPLRPVTLLIIHCTATPAGREVSRAEVDRWHRQRGWNGIGYHYLIHLDGSIEQREFDISTSLLNMSMSQPEHVLQHKEARKYR